MNRPDGTRIGRAKGTPNRITAQVKTAIAEIVAEHLPILKDDLASLSPRERLCIIEKLLAYVVPKATAAEMETETTEPPAFTIEVVNAREEIEELKRLRGEA